MSKNNLLITLPVCATDFGLADRMLDLIFQQNDRQPVGHGLLVFASDVHEEMKTKLRLSASLAFITTSEITAEKNDLQPQQKGAAINAMFQTAADYIMFTYRWPWLWLEPDCVPLKAGWLDDLSEFYAGQPKRYAGAHRGDPVTKEPINQSRIGIYPINSATELRTFTAGEVPFEVAGGKHIIPRSAKCRLIQTGAFKGEVDMGNIREDAVLLHSDKTGQIVEKLIEGLPQPMMRVVKEGTPPKPGGVLGEAPIIEPVKIDKRTKEGKALAAKEFAAG